MANHKHQLSFAWIHSAVRSVVVNGPQYGIAWGLPLGLCGYPQYAIYVPVLERSGAPSQQLDSVYPA